MELKSIFAAVCVLGLILAIYFSRKKSKKEDKKDADRPKPVPVDPIPPVIDFKFTREQLEAIDCSSWPETQGPGDFWNRPACELFKAEELAKLDK